MKNHKMHYISMLVLLVLGNILISVFIIAVVMGTVFYQYVEDEMLTLMQNSEDQVVKYIDDYMGEISIITERLAMDVELGIAVEKFQSDELSDQVEGKYMIDYIIQNALDTHLFIENITIIAGDEMIMQDRYSMNQKLFYEGIDQEKWYQELLCDEKSYIYSENIIYNTVYSGETYYLYATKFKNKFYQTRNQEKRIIVVTFHIKDIKDYMDMVSNNQVFCLSLLSVSEGDGDEEIIYQSNENDSTNQNIIETNTSVFIENNTVGSNWRISGNIKLDIIKQMIYRIEPWMIVSTIIFFFATVIFSIINAIVVLMPMKKMIIAMKDIEKSEFNQIKINSSCIEMDQMVSTYNRMSATIEKLIYNIKKQEEEKRKIEFKILESQINPHFIYNTLENIKCVALINHSYKIADIIESFINLLRISLSRGKDLITVENEVKLVKEYVNIMVFRKNFEVSVHYEISKELEQYYTLKFVLQPFIENCFMHAFEKTQNRKEINIRCIVENGALVFEIVDNGSGYILGEEKNKMTGIGITNVNERLKLWYGNKEEFKSIHYGVVIESEAGKGTKIKISQPIMLEEIL